PGQTATQKILPEVSPTTEKKDPAATHPASETLVPKETAPAPAETKLPPTQIPLPTTEPGRIAPYPDAPLCADTGHAHDNNLFHTLWDDVRGCHYDHEHGQYPFTPEVAAAFPGFDLRTLIGDVGVGHTNPSGPMENAHKHGGFKWQVLLDHPNGCAGHEGSPIGVNASVIQYHAFGDYSIEFEARIHSAVALLRQCLPDNPTDFGYVYVVQHVDYGQRVSGYQGEVLPYSDNPQPAYASGLAPYFTIDCIGTTCPSKTSTRDSILARNNNTSTTWTSDPKKLIGSGSHLFELLFRARDIYQVLDRDNMTYPFTFVWMCSNDGGLTYSAMAGCRYNNSTTRVQEVNGTIPDTWDNLTGFDTDSKVGRITAEGYVTRFGDLNLSCAAPGPDCHPIKMVGAFVGYYGSFLEPTKEGQFGPEALPERDIYFCNGVVCAEGNPGAVSSGWIGPNN
ncbi:MAG: hypothetical protein ACT4QE_11665, partial [Anaerolineales bacterium]